MLPEAPVGDGGPHPGLHVGGGGHDLGAGHLLHLLQSLLSLGGVKVGGWTLAGDLQRNTEQLMFGLKLEIKTSKLGHFSQIWGINIFVDNLREKIISLAMAC